MLAVAGLLAEWLRQIGFKDEPLEETEPSFSTCLSTRTGFGAGWSGKSWAEATGGTRRCPGRCGLPRGRRGVITTWAT